MRLTAVFLLCAAGLSAADEYLHALYDKLHDSPIQRRFKSLRPMPWGVVFLPWAGITEAEIREHYRTMKRLGFHNLKQVMPTPEWPMERLMEMALEEGIIPFWYGEGGWEEITPALLAKLGIPSGTPMAEVRNHPKMRAYQTEVIRKGIAGSTAQNVKRQATEESFRHTPDPYLYDHDVPHFKKWLRETYKTPGEVATAWNEFEVGINDDPIRTWADVDRTVEAMPKEGRNLRGAGREYGRVRDVLLYKADLHARAVKAALTAAKSGNPNAPTRTGGEMGLFLPFAWRATNMEWLADTQREIGSFYPSIHMAWHYGEVHYEVARPVYMQASFATDLFKGGWAAPWESTGGPQQLSGGKGWDYPEQSTTAGFTVNAGTLTQLFFSYLAAGFKGAGLWAWNYRNAGWEGGEYALVNRQLQPTERAVRAGRIAQAAERWRDEIWAAHKEPLAGVLLNWDNDAIWAATSLRGRDHFKHYPMQARVGVSRALINGNVPYEYVTVDDLRAGLAPRYKTIYLACQLALSEELLQLLLKYAEGGGRVVIDSPGAWYDEHGKVLKTGAGTTFEKLFGASVADFAYSNNVPRVLDGEKMTGFISEIAPTRGQVLARFQTGEPAVVQSRTGKGRAVLLGWDASFAAFKPGHVRHESWLREYILGGRKPGYVCDGAIVYRIAAPGADHYFLINDGPARAVKLETPAYQYKAASDAVTGAAVAAGGDIELEAFSGRWIRMEK